MTAQPFEPAILLDMSANPSRRFKICGHVGSIQNSFGDIVFTYFKLEEIRSAADFFLSFFEKGTWVQELAICDRAQQRLAEILLGPGDPWLAWTSMILTNGYCPRVQVLVFLLKVALCIGPLTMIKHGAETSQLIAKCRKKVHGRQRPLFLDAEVFKNVLARRAWVSSFRIRTIEAKQISQGLLTAKQCHEMGRRLVQILRNEFWTLSLACIFKISWRHTRGMSRSNIQCC